MSFLLNRIRRALAQPPQEDMTGPLLQAVAAHWRCLFNSEPAKFEPLREHIEGLEKAARQSQDAQQQCITADLAAMEAKHTAFPLDATLGGLPGQPGPLYSSDWGTHWILFKWSPPLAGGPVWGYRLERSADNREFCLMDVCIDSEVTLLNQPPNQKFYYHVVPFNGCGDGPASPVFGIKFDSELVDWHRRRSDDADDKSKIQENS